MFRTNLKIGVLASLILAVGILLTDTPQAEANGSGVRVYVYRVDLTYSCPQTGEKWFYQSYFVNYYPSTGQYEGVGDVNRAISYIRGQGYNAQWVYVLWRISNNG